MRSLSALALSLTLCAPVAAQYKCVGRDGSTTFQQTPCASDQRGERLNIAVPPSIDDGRPDHIRRAIVERKIVLGMTRAELDRVMGGRPNKVNSSVYESGRKDQLIYYQTGRTLYVYTDDGVVSAVQEQQGPTEVDYANQPAPATYARPARRCPTRKEIRDIEIEQSKIANRGNDRLQAELARRLADARECIRGQ